MPKFFIRPLALFHGLIDYHQSQCALQGLALGAGNMEIHRGLFTGAVGSLLQSHVELQVMFLGEKNGARADERGSVILGGSEAKPVCEDCNVILEFIAGRQNQTCAPSPYSNHLRSENL